MKHPDTTQRKVTRILSGVLIACGLVTLNTNYVQAMQMNYQGVVEQAGVAYQGAGYFKFTLGDVGDTTNYWSNDGASSDEPGTGVSVDVTNGFFHLALGSGMTDIPATVFTDNADVYLRVWFADQLNGSYSALGGAQQILPVPRATTADMR